ncbi:class I SAM-dependent methyltransferase [Candidatus Pacearchaeota archaeon]|nr:class I SAM-dependent methyltransferase [Candidatus Pacearchaeota archaeon]
MVNNIERTKIERCSSLDKAVNEMFGIHVKGRECLFTQEAMTGRLAEEYNKIGLLARQKTYKRIAQDFRNRTRCYSVNHPASNVGTILDVGCGSGLLSLALFEETNGNLVGIDLSKDMIRLAYDNLKGRMQQKIEEVKSFQQRMPESYRINDSGVVKKIFKSNGLEFREGSVYDLQSIMPDIKDVNYIVCRNALHRFKDPTLAIKTMYSTLNNGGRLYIRDLKRDADWKTLLSRIGDERWNSESLVKDYIGAMAQMLTVEELRGILDNLNVSYIIDNGDYKDPIKLKNDGMKEFASDVEYTCVITKPKH